MTVSVVHAYCGVIQAVCGLCLDPRGCRIPHQLHPCAADVSKTLALLTLFASACGLAQAGRGGGGERAITADEGGNNSIGSLIKSAATDAE